MSLTFTEEEVKQLEDAIFNSSSKRSYTSHKKDIKKFLLAYFEKQKIEIKKNEKSQEKKSLSSESSNSKKMKGSNDGYKITKVSKNYEFPSSIYKKDTHEEAAKSALNGIIRKNNLDDKTIFTFVITKGEKSYKYTAKNGKLENH